VVPILASRRPRGVALGDGPARLRSSMMRTTPWILFDIGGVLELDDDGPWQEELANRWAARAGLTRYEYEQLIAGADLPRIDLEQGRAAEYWSGFARLLGFTAAQLDEAAIGS
jgi:hypothetical protein